MACVFQDNQSRAICLGAALTLLPLLLCSNLLFTVGFVIAERVLYIPRFDANQKFTSIPLYLHFFSAADANSAASQLV
jgi:hypothetical protein